MHIRLVVIICLLIMDNSISELKGQSQDEHAFFIRKIYDHSLTEGKAYAWLHHLSEEIGARSAGSEAYNEAVHYTSKVINQLGVDSLFLQKCTVDFWDRGEGNSVFITKPKGEKWKLNSLVLGRSEGNGGHPITGEIIEVNSLDEVEELGEKEIRGKIVFYNRPMDPKQIRTFHAYGGAVDQRVFGASRASKFGGVGALVRSMTTLLDDVPHTGTMAYEEGINPVPGIAISTNDAEVLSELLQDHKVTATLITNSKSLGNRSADNVIGEIKGSTHPDQIILIGGHLDSWDVGGGAHDDGSGCVHAMQVLETLLAMDYQPRHTIRCVLFANEENGLDGAKEYARLSNARGEFHLAAIESDAGGFTPRGFSVDGHADILEAYAKKVSDMIGTYLEPYGLMMSTGGSGADISPLKSQKGILIGLRPDSQRYFDFHHTARDRIKAVNKRELLLGSAAMTSLVYLIDQLGLE